MVISDAKISETLVSEVITKIDAKNETIVVSETTSNDLEQSKAILISVSKLIMDITASDDFNINLDSSKQVADMIQKLLNL